MAQNIQQQKKYTVQDSVRTGRPTGVGLLFWLAQAGQIIAPWWSKRRDEQLRDFWKDSSHYSGAVYMMSSKITSVSWRVEPRDVTVKQHIKTADEFNMLLDEAPQYGQGWAAFWDLFLEDLWNSDNGAFGEVIGDGNPLGPLRGPPLGLAHLDSYSVQRTSDPEYPIIYTDAAGDGKRYRLHHTRCIYASQMPSTASEMHGVGVCWLSRAINSVQNLIDIAIYKQEKLGSRPMRGIIYGSNISTDSILGAIAMAEESMDNQGLSRYAKMAVLGDENREIDLNLLELASLPDGFDEKTATDLAMFVIALTGGFPPRWLWPASTVGATKADAMYQHVAGAGGGLARHLHIIARLLGGSLRGSRHSTGKFLPPFLRLVFDPQDDEQDQMQAAIRKSRAETRGIDIETGVTDVRTAREQALAAGDLTRAQFVHLELEDGRLENGDDILTVFNKPEFEELLSLDLDDPLLIDVNDPLDALIEIETAALNAQGVLATAGTATARSRAQQAIFALGKLKDIYNQLVVEDIQREMQAEQEATETGTAEQREREGDDAASEAEPDEEKAKEQADELMPAVLVLLGDDYTKEQSDYVVDSVVKAFNFGARVGEIIRGRLARGEGGRFVSAEDIQQAKSDVLQRLIERLRARRQQKTAKRGRAKKPKKPKKPGGGGRKPKKTPQQLEEEKRAKIQANLNRVFGAEGGLAEKMGLERNDLLALEQFRFDGKDMDASAAKRFAQLGFVEIDADGNPRMTSAGRSMLSAASRGDVRGASDALSRARERVTKQRKRIADRRERASKLRQRAEAADDEDRAAELLERAEEIDADADAREQSIGGVPDEEKSIYLINAPRLCAGAGSDLKQTDDGPPRGDFEQEIADALKPIFADALDETLTAVDNNEEPNYDEMREQIITAMVPILASAAVFSFNQGEEQFQLFDDGGELNDAALAWARERANVLADQLVNTTRNIAARARQQSDDGATDEEIGSTADRAFDEERRERIGITETTTALAIGLLLYKLFARRNNVELEEIWYTRLDERVCPVCAPLHGTTEETWGSEFPNGPPAHVKCRCGKEIRKKRKR